MNSEKRRIAAGSLVVLVSISLAACAPALPFVGQNPAAPLASPLASPLPTETLPSPTPTLVPTLPPTATPSFTPIPSLTATAPTAETLTTTPTTTVTGTLTTPAGSASPGTPTPTATGPTPTEPRFAVVGTLRPGVDYTALHIDNRSHSQADVSLHCMRPKDQGMIMEFNGVKRLTVQVPMCDYLYVVYVGGKQIVGNFSIHGKFPVKTFIVYADHVSVH